MIYIGIDPGKKGGMAEILSSDIPEVNVYASEKHTERDLANQLYACQLAEPLLVFAYLELIAGSQPKFRGVQGIASLNRSYGFFRGCLITAGIPFEEVSAQKWQAEFGLKRKKNETDTQKKNRHKAKAQQLFPDLKVTHAVADALLIAEYCRRMRRTG